MRRLFAALASLGALAAFGLAASAVPARATPAAQWSHTFVEQIGCRACALSGETGAAPVVPGGPAFQVFHLGAITAPPSSTTIALPSGNDTCTGFGFTCASIVFTPNAGVPGGPFDDLLINLVGSGAEQFDFATGTFAHVGTYTSVSSNVGVGFLTVSVIPEPASALLLLAGLPLLARLRRRR